MSSRNIHEHLSLLIEVERKEANLKALFRTASRTLVESELPERELFEDEIEAERYFALFWLHFAALQFEEEPKNDLLLRSMNDAQIRVDDVLQPNDYPWELS